MAHDTIEYGFARDGKVFLKPFLHFEERQIGEVRDSDQSSLEYFTERFGMAVQKVEELEQLIETSVNKGSYLMKLLHMKEYLSTFDALGDFESLFHRLENQEAKLQELILVNRQRNFEIKNVLLLELEQATQLPDWKEATEKVLDIKSRWIKTGSVEKELQEKLEGQFASLVQDFFDRKKVFFEDRQRLLEQKAEFYKGLLDQVQALSKSEDKTQAFEQLKKLQAAWKEGPEMASKTKKELWAEFKKYSDLVFNAYKKSSKPKQGESMEQIIAQRKQWLQQVQSLGDNPSPEVVSEIKRIQEEWKRGGMLPKYQSEELNDQFFIACDFVTEQLFLNRLAFGKNRDFDQKSTKEQVQIKVRLIRDLLLRDEKELETFTDNFEKLNTSKLGFDRMLVGKLNMQKRKVKVKKLILDKLQADLARL